MAVSLLAGYALFKVRHPTTDLPLAGGKVYTYARNTTTNKTAWTDAAKTVAHPNPIILDPAGEAVIYWDGEYKVRVDDSDNVTVRTMDDFNLQASGSDTISDQEGNQLVNGSFEIDTDGDNLPDGWDVTQNGTVAFDTSDVNHGGQSLKFTSIGAAGGGEIVSSAFLNVVEARPNIFRYGVKIDWTSGTCRVVGQVDWYSEAEVFISTTTMFTNDYTGDVAWANPAVSVTPPTGATKAKLKIIGISDGITGVGSIWLDNMMFYISNSLDLTQTNATQTVNSAVQFADDVTFANVIYAESGVDATTGVYITGATGGAKGAHTFNSPVYYKNGVEMRRAVTAFHDSNQSINNSTDTFLGFDNELFDDDTMHDKVINNSRLEVPSGVTRIRLCAHVAWANNANGERGVIIVKNRIGGVPGGTLQIKAATLYDTIMTVTTPILEVADTDFFEITVRQNSGGALIAGGGSNGQNTSFSMEVVE